MATWSELVNLIFRDSGVLGVGQSLQAQDTTDAVFRIKMMLNEWRRKRWLVFHLVDLSITMDGSLFYTIGDLGDIDATRPNSIESAFCRQLIQAQPNQPDFPLRIVNSYEEYSRLTLKSLAAGPAWILFYDSGYPLGKLYPWPLMNSQYSLHIQVKADLPTDWGLADEIALPPEYEQAIYATQVNATRAAYRLPMDPYYKGLAKSALQTLRSSNFQVPTLQMPAAVSGRGAYNIFSDSFGPSRG